MMRYLSKLLGPFGGRIGVLAVSVFLNFAGFTIIIPVLPFSVGRYVAEADVATYVSLILSIYALCAFLSAPVLGALSDRYGRRLIIVLSMLGAAVGFTIFGIGGALSVLILGRVIEGLTAGSISAMFAYVADSFEPSERGAAFGMLGAAGGLGFMCGPALGGLLGEISLSAPLYGAAALAVANALFVYSALPETRPQTAPGPLEWRQINPLGAMILVFREPSLRTLFAVAFLFFGAATLMQANLAVFLKDRIGFGVGAIGWVLFGVGLMDIVSQGVAAPRLLARFTEKAVATSGLLVNAAGFLLLAVLAFVPSVPLLAAAMAILTFGDGLVQPALSALISDAAPEGEQGRVQGANQSQQAIARMIGPIASALLYALHPTSPYLAGAIILTADALFLATVFLSPAKRTQHIV